MDKEHAERIGHLLGIALQLPGVMLEGLELEGEHSRFDYETREEYPDELKVYLTSINDGWISILPRNANMVDALEVFIAAETGQPFPEALREEIQSHGKKIGYLQLQIEKHQKAIQLAADKLSEIEGKENGA